MIACESGEEHSFIETGQPWRCHLECRHELKRVWVKSDIGITTLWHRHGNNLINCTEISLMNSYVVISMRSNSRMSFSFLMGRHSCSFGCFPFLFFSFSFPQFSVSLTHIYILSLSLSLYQHCHPMSVWEENWLRIAELVVTLKWIPDRKEIIGWFLYESCIFFLWCF